MSECTHIGIETWGKNRRALRGKQTKDELLSKISSKFNRKVVDLQTLNIKDLQSILNTNIPTTEINIPTGRFKQPYIDVLVTVFPKEIDFSKASVVGLRSLLEAIR